jgi:hypothetical protein
MTDVESGVGRGTPVIRPAEPGDVDSDLLRDLAAG